MQYSIVFTNEAAGDVQAIYDYIAQHGPGNPDDWKAGLGKQIEWLEQSAEACGTADELAN